MKRQTVSQELATAKKRFSKFKTASLDAEILLSFLLGVSREYLFAWPDRDLSQKECSLFEEMIARREKGEPIAYITGYKEFWSLQLFVTPDTLIPRSETELLVEMGLELLPNGKSCKIADLGTGCGAIALALAKERPESTVIATDCSFSALEVAKENAKKLGLNNVQFLQGSWCDSLQDREFDVILSNPPYVDKEDSCLFCEGVVFEPRGALVADNQGMEMLDDIAQKAMRCLRPEGFLLFEHGATQGSRVREILLREGCDDIVTVQDLLKLDRVTRGRKFLP